jgi:hypothetical protein
MDKITKLPTMHEATLKIMNHQELTLLDEFIIDHEPLHDSKKNSFRYDLLQLIKDIQTKS